MATDPPHPAKNPCGSCPYRRDSPSGLWHESEYDKLPEYDKETGYQPGNPFFCHQAIDRLCAGWVGCHDMDENLALRMASLGIHDDVRPEDVDAIRDYSTDVPLFGSGQEARDHGMERYYNPGPEKDRAAAKIRAKRKDVTL